MWTTLDEWLVLFSLPAQSLFGSIFYGSALMLRASWAEERKNSASPLSLPGHSHTMGQCVWESKTVIFGSAQKWHSRESWTLTAKKRMGAWCHSDMRKNDIFSFYVSSKDFHTRINVGYIVYTNAYAPRT